MEPNEKRQSILALFISLDDYNNRSISTPMETAIPAWNISPFQFLDYILRQISV